MNKTDKKYLRIIHHGEQLRIIFPAAKLEPIPLYRAVRNLELRAHRLAESGCSDPIYSEGEYFARKSQEILTKPDAILHFRQVSIPVFLNGDPRGYALKIAESYVHIHKLPITTDWGGYGILAPDFD